MKGKNVALWVLTPFVSYLSLFVAIGVCSVILILLIPLEVPVSEKTRLSLFGSVSAFFFVVSGAYIAPAYKMYAALFLFFVGAYISWDILGGFKEPGSIKLDYVPLVVTYLSGLTGIVFVNYTMKHNKSFEDDAGTQSGASR